jgi:Flp pilus assembly protein TadD
VEKRQTDISQEHSYDEADMLRAIAMCYARIGEPSHAIVFFQRYLDIREGDPETFRIMGTCFLNAGNLPRALHYLSLAELGGAALSTMALPLTYIHMQQGNMEEARKYFLALDAEGLGDGQTIALFRSIVEAHYEKHLLSELCGFLERLAINAPHQPFIVDALGTARIKAGNFAAAVEAYESLRVLDPLNPQVARRLAALSLKLGNPAKAEIYLRGIR